MNRTTGIVVAAVVFSSIAPAPALAADTGFYLSAGIGRAEEDPGKSNGANFSIGFPPAGVVHLEPERVDVDGGDTSWSVGMGYKFSQYFAAEVEYLDFGTTEIAEHYSLDVPPLPDEITLNYSSRITGSAISVLGSLPVGNGFEVYLRAGALYAHREFAVLLPVEAGSPFCYACATGSDTRRSGKPQRANRIFLEDERLHLGLESGLGEVLHPAIRRDQRKVRAEEHLVPELGVRVAHQLG